MKQRDVHPRWIIVGLVVFSLAGAFGLTGIMRGCREPKPQFSERPVGADTTLDGRWRDWMKGYEKGFRDGVWAAKPDTMVWVIEYVAVSDGETLGCPLPPKWIRYQIRNVPATEPKFHMGVFDSLGVDSTAS